MLLTVDPSQLTIGRTTPPPDSAYGVHEGDLEELRATVANLAARIDALTEALEQLPRDGRYESRRVQQSAEHARRLLDAARTVTMRIAY